MRDGTGASAEQSTHRTTRNLLCQTWNISERERVESIVTNSIKIDVWSDIACPWCYIGKRNLEAGLRQTSEDENAPVVEIEFHSYELSPDTPVDFEGNEEDFLAKHKGMSVESVREMMAHVTEVAKNVGLDYRFDILKHTNTVKAHELLHFAKSKGVQHDVEERLMSAYFTEGRHVGHIDELAKIAGEAGLDEAEAADALKNETYLEDVRRDQAQAGVYGINGVPFFVINNKYGVSGAQPADAFAQIVRQVWNEDESAAGQD